jgi:hypothetical protein
MDRASELTGILRQIIDRLKSNQAAVKRQIDSNEQQKNELLLSLE